MIQTNPLDDMTIITLMLSGGIDLSVAIQMIFFACVGVSLKKSHVFSFFFVKGKP